MLLWERLKHHADRQGEKPALCCDSEKLTYAEFAARAEALAQSWLAQGLAPGDRIALHLRNGLELATCYYACFAVGFVAVPINTRLRAEEVTFVLEHSGARAYLAADDLRIPSSVPSLKPETQQTGPLPTPDPDAPALLLYTSGTTARPKGVTHSQRTLAGNGYYMDDWGLKPDDHTLLFTSMAHASGSIMLFMSSLWMGATVTIVPVFDAGVALDTWAKSGATFFMSLPTLIRALITEQRARPRSIKTGRLVICGGDTVPVTLQQDYTETFGHPMVEGFGMTEGLPTLANRVENNRPGTLGRPVGDVELRVVEGEMWMRGCGIATGYWGDAPFQEGWLKTGDLVEIDADGFVWFRGRKKEIIVRGGSNISPQEVEEALYQHSAVAEAGVIGEADDYWGEVVVAYVAVRNGHHASAEQLIAHCRQHLAEYKCPERVLFLDVLPKGATGKVQRRALKELLKELRPIDPTPQASDPGASAIAELAPARH